MTELMKAVQIHEFGNQTVLKLNDIDIPVPDDHAVLIKVYASSVNPVDWKIREGYLQGLLNHSLPLTLGWDVAGVVARIGSKVSNLKVGDDVYSRPNIANNGSYAQYMTVSADEVALKPKSLSFQEAAGVPLAGLTAWQAMYEISNVQPGERVLIHAGSGAVGQFAIQLAKLRGAFVYTTTSAKNTELVLSLGADQVINYQQEDFSELRGLDIVFDTLGGDTLAKSWATLKQGGRIVSVVENPDELKAKELGIKAAFCFVQPNAEQLTKLAQLADAGKFKVNIDSEFPLEQVDQAHLRSESGRAQGKIIINIAD